MSDFKLYIIRIVIVVSIVQLGVIMSGEKYKKLYSLVGAIFIVFAMLSFPNFDFGYFNFNYQLQTGVETGEDNIAKAFTESVSEKIEDGIKETCNTEADVTVQTDENFSKLHITIDCCCPEEISVKIDEYVKKTFCTQNDEVIITNGYAV